MSIIRESDIIRMEKSANTLRAGVKKHVLNMIQTGTLLAGDKIKESDLCRELNISRTPIREALNELVTENVLDSQPHRGFSVVKKSQKEKNDVYIVLAELDALAAVLALDRITDEHILQLCEIVDMLDITIKYKNYPKYCNLQNRFHAIYREVCDNEFLQKLLMDMQEGFIPMTFFSEDLDPLFDIYQLMNDEHRVIIDLFKHKKRAELYEYLKNTHWALRYEDMF